MTRLKTLGRSAALFVAMTAGTAFAGPIADFKAEMADAYGTYRMALFATNTGDAEKSDKAIAGFEAKWKALAGHWSATPPPHLSEDSGWHDTLEEVAAIAANAQAKADEGNLAESHEVLEKIRDSISELNRRNGVVTFSDHMNAYHAEMEHVIGSTYDGEGAAKNAVADAAVLGYLAGRLAAEAPTAYAQDASFNQALAALQDSVAALDSAARSGDLAAVAKAKAGLKKPYSMLFLKFG